jgi:hypothetical protein
VKYISYRRTAISQFLLDEAPRVVKYIEQTIAWWLLGWAGIVWEVFNGCNATVIQDKFQRSAVQHRAIGNS